MNNISTKINSFVSESVKEIACLDLEKYVEEKKENFAILFQCKYFIEGKALTLRCWETYTKVKYYLKELALNQIQDKFDILKEEAFYHWLKICINPQREVNYDFYFEKNKLDKEEEVRRILFEEDGKGRIRDIFTKDDWQIRLRTIADWFLKRYDIATARKIYKNINPHFKTCFDKVKLWVPRLIGAVFIGFLPLIMGQEIWELPLKLGWCWTVILSILSGGFAYLYLTLECYYITKKNKGVWGRAFKILCIGVLYSLIFALFITSIMGKHFIVSDELMRKGVDFFGIQIFFNNVIFFASAALLIGIFIQIFWEEKTITEPL